MAKLEIPADKTVLNVLNIKLPLDGQDVADGPASDAIVCESQAIDETFTTLTAF